MQWLPRTLHVAFGGAITSPDGNDISPQIYILIMNDTYPMEMIEKDLFLIDGVLAAFECKATLRSADIAKAVKTSSMLKQWCQNRSGNPYAELYSPVTYGLLAHGHCWTKEKSRPEQNVINRLMREDRQTVNHPRESLDLICVANLGTWANWKNTLRSPVRGAFTQKVTRATSRQPTTWRSRTNSTEIVTTSPPSVVL